MNGTFNGQILVDKLAKLNSSQQSIETLSHWCIFHMNNAKQVVEIWNRQFHCSPREQRLSFLYLANDILQNSRRKGAEFGSEFWKVLPGALGDVMENGDAPGKSAALRLVDIWDDRKVFGTRGKLLKEGIAGRNLDNTNKKEKASCLKLKQSVGNILEKIISGYEVVYDGPIEETSLFSKCKSAMDGIDKIDKEIGNDCSSGQLNGSEYVELQGQNGILRECIEQLRASESSRATLVSHLKEALQEQEFKLGEIRAQLQVAQSKSEKAGNISQQLVNLKGGEQHNNRSTEEQTTFVSAVPTDTPPEKEQTAPVMYTQRGPYVEDIDPRKSAAAAVAAKLAASTSSAQMLTYVLSSLASEGVIDSLSDYPSEKRPKHDNGSGQQHQPPLPPFPHPDSTQPKPPPPSSSPLGSTMQQQSPVRPQQLPLQPPSTQFMPTTGPYTYSPLQQPPPFTSYPLAGPSHSGAPGYPSPGPYQTYHAPAEGGFFNQPPMPASSPPMSRH